MDDNGVSIAISFGGTKIALALVDSRRGALIRQTERIEWRTHPLWTEQAPLASLIDLVAITVRRLMEETDVSVGSIRRVGIAWPGPGRYSMGLLAATFIPGCTEPVNIHALVLESLGRQVGPRLRTAPIKSRLDVGARALGEIALPQGAFRDGCGRNRRKSGVVLNIATGIAGAVVHEGGLVTTLGRSGENYGQWGRYLLRKQTGTWRSCATPDGAIPAYDTAEETRFTDLCGGPALARRFNAPEHDRPRERDVVEEKNLLESITRVAYQGNEAAAYFLTMVGSEVGEAMRCLRGEIGASLFGDRLVLTGGIGENIGLPPSPDEQRDIFLESVSHAVGDPGVRVVRSAVGLEAELVGCVA